MMEAEEAAGQGKDLSVTVPAEPVRVAAQATALAALAADRKGSRLFVLAYVGVPGQRSSAAWVCTLWTDFRARVVLECAVAWE